jgi:hypothetical protein
MIRSTRGIISLPKGKEGDDPPVFWQTSIIINLPAYGRIDITYFLVFQYAVLGEDRRRFSYLDIGLHCSLKKSHDVK